MDSSEEQFQELIAQLVARSNKMLSEQNYLLPVSILLSKSKKIEIVLPSVDASDQLQELVNVIQIQVKEKVRTGQYKATCIAYPDYTAGSVIALLESEENYCAKVTIPVNIESALDPTLVPEEAIVEDGGIYVFPAAHSS